MVQIININYTNTHYHRCESIKIKKFFFIDHLHMETIWIVLAYILMKWMDWVDYYGKKILIIKFDEIGFIKLAGRLIGHIRMAQYVSSFA